jgi:hypothetical protein
VYLGICAFYVDVHLPFGVSIVISCFLGHAICGHRSGFSDAGGICCFSFLWPVFWYINVVLFFLDWIFAIWKEKEFSVHHFD